MSVVDGDVLSALRKMRNVPRSDEKYSIFRAIYMKLKDMVAELSSDIAEQERILQDLENIAVMRAVQHYAWMKDDYIWSYSHKTRKTKLWTHLKDVFEKRIVRNDELLRNFLINVELVTFIKEYNGNAEAFWKKIGVESNECNQKQYS